jgi:RimJ/RimL family protein N-acetyltransferase
MSTVTTSSGVRRQEGSSNMAALAALGVAPLSTSTPISPARPDWRSGLPILSGSIITLRELRASDATSLLASLGSVEVTRLISPPPPTVEGFEKFIAWTKRQREAGKSIAYGVTLKESDVVVGVFQVRSIKSGFGVAECGFALGSAFWGSGIFMDAARLVFDFAFDCIGVHRMEAKAAVKNGRGNGAMQKLGMVQEAILRRSFLRNGVYLDQACWALLADTWRELKTGRDPAAIAIVH